MTTPEQPSPRELALAIQVLRDTHYRHCRHGEWSEEECPVFVAWARRWEKVLHGGQREQP